MRIALVVPGNYYSEGAPKYVPSGTTVYYHGLAKALQKAGHDVVLLCFGYSRKDSGNLEYICDGVYVCQFPWLASDLDRAMSIHEWLLSNAVDVVESTQCHALLLIEQLVGGTPTVVRMTTDFFENVAAGDTDFGKTRRVEWSKHLLSCHCIARSSQVLCSTHRQMEFVSAWTDRFQLVAPGVDASDIPEDIERQSLISIVVGDSKVPRKGGAMVDEIVKHLPTTYEVAVIGGSKEHPLDRCELFLQYAKSTFVVVPERSSSFGYSFLEPMACGTPVICFDQGDKYRNAWPMWNLGPWGSGESIGAIPKLFQALESEDYGELSQRVRDFALNFLWEKVIDSHMAAYSRAIAHSLLSGKTRGW